MGSVKKYIRVAKGFNKYDLYEAGTDVKEIIKKDPDSPYYSSLYYYDESHFDQYKKTNSVAGIKGLKTNRLVFDLDNKTDTELARHDTITLCSRLIQNGVDQDKIQVYFSGSKGFHVELNTTDEFNREEFTNILENLAGDLSSIDRKVLDEQRIFRIPLTKHQETGLYKIPLTLNELNDSPVDIIKINAEHILDEHVEMMNRHLEVILPDSIRKLKNITKVNKATNSSINLTFNEEFDVTNKPKWMSTTRYAIQEGFFPAGQRHHALMIMCATYKNNGFPKTMAFEMLKDVAERQGKRTDTEPHSAKEIWNNIVNSVYSPHWVGGIYSDKTDPLLIEIARTLNLKPEIEVNNNFTIGELKGKFVDYAKNITQNTVKFGIKEIDENVFISTGMAVGILGAPGASKSTWAYNISENLSNNEQLVLFHQMDMFDAATYARLIGKYNNYSMKQCLEKILNNEIDEQMAKSFEEVEKRFRNVIFDFRTGLTVEDIEQSLIETEQKMGTKVKLLVVDYLEKIRGPYSDDTANSGFIAARLSDIAKKHNVCVLILLQPQKVAGDPREELLTYTKIKGSGKIQQDLRVVMTIWRPGYNPRDNTNDKYVSMEVVKNNMGGLHHFDFMWDGIRGDIRSMDKDEKNVFRNFLERLKEEKAEQQRKEGFNPFV